MQDQRQQRKGARVPSFSRRHEQEGKQDKLHNIREDKGKRDRPKEAKATATEAANKANQTELSNGSAASTTVLTRT